MDKNSQVEFVDFFGIPGSGKSYHANIISKERNLEDYYRYLFSKKGNFLFKIFVHFRLGNILAPVETNQLMKLYEPFLNNNNHFGFPVSLKNYVHQIIYLIFVKKRMKKNNKSSLFDEGILHHIIAIEVEFLVPHEVSVKAYDISEHFNTENIYINSSVENAFNRIKERNRKYSSMDYLDDEKLNLFLEAYKESCDRFSEEMMVEVIEND